MRSIGKPSFHAVSPFLRYETATTALRLSSPSTRHSKPREMSVGGSAMKSREVVRSAAKSGAAQKSRMRRKKRMWACGSLIRPFGPPSPGGRRTRCGSFPLPPGEGAPQGRVRDPRVRYPPVPHFTRDIHHPETRHPRSTSRPATGAAIHPDLGSTIRAYRLRHRLDPACGARCRN